MTLSDKMWPCDSLETFPSWGIGGKSGRRGEELRRRKEVAVLRKGLLEAGPDEAQNIASSETIAVNRCGKPQMQGEVVDSLHAAVVY